MSKQSKSKQSKASKAIAAPVAVSDFVPTQAEAQRVMTAVVDAANPLLRGQKVGKKPVKLPEGTIAVIVEAITGSHAKRSTVHGHFAQNRWSADGVVVNEIAISPYFLASQTPTEITATLAHEYLHAVALASDIKDTSRQGRFHNDKYAQLVALLPNLLAEGPRDRQIGVTTKPSQQCETWCKEELMPQFGSMFKMLEDKPKAATRNTVRFVCDCGNKAIVSVKQAGKGFVPLCGHAHAARPMTRFDD